jgi:hypothetical protein
VKPARQVVKPTTRRSVGIVNVSWLQADGIPHESELEAAFIRHAVLCSAVQEIAAQPFRLPWVDSVGVDRTYVPDFQVRLTDGAKIVVEIRPSRYIDQDREKFDAAAQILGQKGIDFVVISDERLPKPLQKLAKIMLRSARGDMASAVASRACDIVTGAGVCGLAWSDALSTEISEQDWHHLLGRRQLVADTGITLLPTSRLHQPMNWPGAREHERLQFDRWFGCQAWGQNTRI